MPKRAQGLFLSVLSKTQFTKNAKTQFQNPKTQFENCKTLKNWQFYASHQNKFNFLLVQPAENPFKTQIFIHECYENHSKNAKFQFEHANNSSENPKTQFENAKTKKNRSSTCASFPG